jgi:hypothetical protein
MKDQDSAALRGAVEEAIGLFHSRAPRVRAALSPLVNSLEAVCTSLQFAVVGAAPSDGHAAVLVVSRDLIATALAELALDKDVDTRGVTLALAMLHNRIVAALDACTATAME